MGFNKWVLEDAVGLVLYDFHSQFHVLLIGESLLMGQWVPEHWLRFQGIAYPLLLSPKSACLIGLEPGRVCSPYRSIRNSHNVISFWHRSFLFI